MLSFRENMASLMLALCGAAALAGPNGTAPAAENWEIHYPPIPHSGEPGDYSATRRLDELCDLRTEQVCCKQALAHTTQHAAHTCTRVVPESGKR